MGNLFVVAASVAQVFFFSVLSNCVFRDDKHIWFVRIFSQFVNEGSSWESYQCGLIIEKQKQCRVCVCILWLIAINICVLWHFVLCKCVLTWLFKDCTARCCDTEVRAICCVLCLSSGHVHGVHLKTVLIMQSPQLIRSEAATVERPQVIVKGRCGKYGKVNVSLESERVVVIQRVTVMLARLATRKDHEFHSIQHCRTQKPTSVVCFWMFYVDEE